jgi:hypothetical protein
MREQVNLKGSGVTHLRTNAGGLKGSGSASWAEAARATEASRVAESNALVMMWIFFVFGAVIPVLTSFYI